MFLYQLLAALRFLLVVRMQTEKKFLKVCISQGPILTVLFSMAAKFGETLQELCF